VSHATTGSPTIRRRRPSYRSSMPTSTSRPNASTAAICSRPAAKTSQPTSSGASMSCSPAPNTSATARSACLPASTANGGQLDGVRVLSRTSVQLMTSDHLGARIAAPLTPGELLLGTPGYTMGLVFAVRQGNGIAGVPGSAGEFMWARYAGTYFWVDPKEELAVVYMSQAPSPIRAYYRRLLKQLVAQAIID
jgi:CubicO group peptidase (beta-lactamase class C family)